MILTNKLNLPQAFVNAVSNVRHNDYKTLSATTLLKGNKEIILTHRHFDEITQDVSDLVWASFGSAFHLFMENQEDDSFKEEKFEVSLFDWKITGKVDRYDLKNETIEDWKTTSVWKIIKKEFTEWRIQGLIYAWLMKQNGLNVRHIRFVALLKDHSKTEARRSSSYPQDPVYIYEYDVNEDELKKTEEFIKAKLSNFIKITKYEDDVIPECSPEERWVTPVTYAVMKDGRKKALKVFESEDEAQKFIDEQEKDKDKLSIEERKGLDKKCMEYCPCAQFCSYYQQVTRMGEK